MAPPIFVVKMFLKQKKYVFKTSEILLHGARLITNGATNFRGKNVFKTKKIRFKTSEILLLGARLITNGATIFRGETVFKTKKIRLKNLGNSSARRSYYLQMAPPFFVVKTFSKRKNYVEKKLREKCRIERKKQ